MPDPLTPLSTTDSSQPYTPSSTPVPSLCSNISVVIINDSGSTTDTHIPGIPKSPPISLSIDKLCNRVRSLISPKSPKNTSF